jgi:hypothetical protein
MVELRRLWARLRDPLPTRARLSALSASATRSAQIARLTEIIENLNARLAEAHERGWLGEIEGIEASLAAADQRLASMQRTANQQTVRVGLGATRSPNILGPLSAESPSERGKPLRDDLPPRPPAPPISDDEARLSQDLGVV